MINCSSDPASVPTAGVRPSRPVRVSLDVSTGLDVSSRKSFTVNSNRNVFLTTSSGNALVGMKTSGDPSCLSSSPCRIALPSASA